MFDKQAFHSLSYGMYVIGARCDGRDYLLNHGAHTVTLLRLGTYL